MHSQKAILNIYREKSTLTTKLAHSLATHIKLLTESKDQVDIALSGGNTPLMLFSELVHLKPDISWKKVHIYWVDERCVPPDHADSNFGNAYAALLEPLSIPASSYHRIKGEDNPASEAERYSRLIIDSVSPDMTFPVFDYVLLGIGTDGHVASIFPDQIEKWKEESLCTVGSHPDSGQYRVSFTGHLINAARKVVFMAAGKEKAHIVKEVVSHTGNYKSYPASLVNPASGDLEWYIDEAAASLL